MIKNMTGKIVKLEKPVNLYEIQKSYDDTIEFITDTENFPMVTAIVYEGQLNKAIKAKVNLKGIKLKVDALVQHYDDKLKRKWFVAKEELISKLTSISKMEKGGVGSGCNPSIGRCGRIPDKFWHGSPTGDFGTSPKGIHIGSKEAAKEALEARIGIPALGEWDGTREYGKTLLAGSKTLMRLDPNMNNFTGYNVDAPIEDYYPTGKATFGDRKSIPLNVKPNVFPVRITGNMTNTPDKPHTDSVANGLIIGQLKRGTAKNGYYYYNEGEDSGSISAVVPN